MTCFVRRGAGFGAISKQCGDAILSKLKEVPGVVGVVDAKSFFMRSGFLYVNKLVLAFAILRFALYK